jgi:ABC-2 type transport system ATP-binding protein
MTETAIYTQDLVKEFKTRGGKITAVDHVTLEIPKGDTFGLIGPDGAGKTTLTRVILGLYGRTHGKSGILGFDSMHHTYAIRERVGYIAQQFALPADLTVKENMEFFANIQCVSSEDQKKRVPQLLDFAGLSEFTGRLAGQLSGGMKKKLALACSLIHEPQVVMLDEPTLGVDPVSRREFWNLLGHLRAEKGLTICVCTPYMDEAERCSRVGLMYAGRLIANDTPRAIKSRIPGDLLEFRPDRFVPAQKWVNTQPGVMEVQTYGAMLHVFVDEFVLRGPEIEAGLTAQGIGFSPLRKIEVRMEEAFISLISRETSKSLDSKVLAALPADVPPGGR